MNKRTVLGFLLACSLAQPVLAAGSEPAVAPEVSPPGDIPDNQAFVIYKSPAGFSIKVPEGWARKDAPNQTIYSDKYNRISLTVTDVAVPVDMAYAKSVLVPEVESIGRASSVTKVSRVKLKAGATVKIAFDSNSEPNAVTNKQVREENERFYFAKGGKLVTLQLSAPKGADNVDQWKLISSSFRWN